jgi:hypothetical protein
MNPEDILEAAHVIRLYLPDLIGAEAEAVDHALADLLAKATSGESIDNQLLELLAERAPTRDWTRQFLTDKIPPPVTRGYDPLAGSQSVIDANMFVCQVSGCSRVWFRPKAGIAPPNCQEHQIPLIPTSAQTD